MKALRVIILSILVFHFEAWAQLDNAQGDQLLLATGEALTKLNQLQGTHSSKSDALFVGSSAAQFAGPLFAPRSDWDFLLPGVGTGFIPTSLENTAIGSK